MCFSWWWCPIYVVEVETSVVFDAIGPVLMGEGLPAEVV